MALPHYLARFSGGGGGGRTEQKGVLTFPTNCVMHFLFQEEFGKISWKYTSPNNVKHPLTCHRLMKLEFSRVSENHKNKISWKSAQLFNADGQTGMTTVTVVCRNFANAPKIGAVRSRSVPRKRKDLHGKYNDVWNVKLNLSQYLSAKFSRQ